MLFDNDEKKAIKKHLVKIQKTGVDLFLDGKLSTPETIASQCVKEELTYMPDFIRNNRGRLTQVRYDCIRDF